MIVCFMSDACNVAGLPIVFISESFSKRKKKKIKSVS